MSFLSDFTKKFFDKLQSLRDVNISSPQDGESLKYDSTTEKWINGTVSGGHTIQDEGTPLTQRTNLNFVGDSVAVTDDSTNDATVVTISGTGGGTTEVTSSAIINRYYENITTVKDTFNIEYSIVDSQAYVDVWLNGVKLAPTEFTATDGNSVVLDTPVDGSVNPQEIEIVAAFAAGVDDVATSITRTIYRYTATAGQTDFEVGYDSKDDLDVYIEGHRLTDSEYTATNGTLISLTSPAILDENVEIVAYKGVSSTDPLYTRDGLILEFAGELDGNILLDTAGNYSTPVTGTALNTTGKVGDAVSFDGSTHYLIGPDKSELELYQFSASCWVYLPSTLSANNTILGNYNSSYGYILHILSDRTVRLSSYSGSSNGITTTTVLNIGQWYHLTFIYKNSTEASIYIDGVQDVVGPLVRPNFPSTTIHFVVFGGIYSSGFTQRFNGYIDQFRLYNRALTEIEVSQLYNSGNGI